MHNAAMVAAFYSPCIEKILESMYTYRMISDDDITKLKDSAAWRGKLASDQYRVMREKGTEKPFTGEYYHSNDVGMYVCAACGNELFTSETKFDSGTGWPSFTDPANRAHVELREDQSHGMVRTEVVCGKCGAHLGHVFDDGPGASGKRYCINSVCLDLKKADEKKP